MKKSKKKNVLESEVLTRFYDVKTYIFNKYYNIFMNKLDIGNVDYQQKEYILRNMWGVGTLSCFPLKGTKGATEHPQGLLVFCGYAPIDYNTYDWPVHATLINKRGVSFIPSTVQTIDKDIVIGFAQRNKKPIKYIVDYYARKIALVETAIQTQILAQKMPFVFATTPENKEKVEELWLNILDDNPALFIDALSIEEIKVLLTNGNFNIDKLRSLVTDYENELRESIGLDNLGVHEKKEHLVNKEIEANDEITEDSGSCIFDCLTEWSAQIKKIFNYDMPITWKDSKKSDEKEAEVAEEDTEQEEEI